MTKATFEAKVLVKGDVVTFNYAGVKRTGTFKKVSGQYPTKCLVIWQKDGETSPSAHYVSYQAIHSPKTDAMDKAKADAEAFAKAQKKAEREAQKAAKAEPKNAKKAAKTIKKVATPKDPTHGMKPSDLIKLADAVKTLKDLGFDVSLC